jgi:hypothetical protein
MQYHIDGPLQVDIRRENDAWAVYAAEPGTRGRLKQAVRSARLEEDDLAAYLEALVQESLAHGA